MKHGGVRRRRDAERGVSAVEFAMLTPLLFFFLFATVQFGLYFFARHVALAAAQEGDRVARSEAGNPIDARLWQTDATGKVDVWIQRLAPNLLNGYQATAVPGPDPQTVTVTVTATVPSMIPGLTINVTVHSTGPIEQFVPDN
ncbi:MAG: TadE/TadG family type IV pilus assembly protein [Actinocrinis sp.]